MAINTWAPVTVGNTHRSRMVGDILLLVFFFFEPNALPALVG